MKNPDFIKISEGFGLKARKVEHPSELDAAIDEMLAHKGPYFLEVVVEREENVFPMVPTGASVADIRLE
jgi:acetolactate synthase-1/2/3 large subunit